MLGCKGDLRPKDIHLQFLQYDNEADSKWSALLLVHTHRGISPENTPETDAGSVTDAIVYKLELAAALCDEA